MDESKIAELVREERRKYSRAWRTANREKVKIYNQNYWKKRVEKKSKEGGGDYANADNSERG